MDTLLESYFLQTNPKSRLFQNVKEVTTIGIPKIGTTPILGIPIVVTFSTTMPISGIPKIWKFPAPIFQSTIQKYPYPVCIEQSNILPTLQGIGRVPFSLFSHYF